ncbi:MAG: hypothetical protein RIT25_3077 [Planctomycetota bacterium]
MNHRVLSAAVLATALSSLSLSAQDKAVSFETHVLPILEKNCVECHRTEYVDENGKKVRPKAGLVLDTKAGIMAGRKKKPVIVAGKPESSELYEVVTLADDDEDRMPPKDKKAALSAADKETLKNWIAGATDVEKMFGTWEGKPSGGAKKTEEKKEAAEGKKDGAEAKGKPAEGERPTREKPAGGKPSGDKPAGTPPAGGRGE